VGVISKGTFLFIVPETKVFSSLAYVRLPAIGASEFVDTGACEFALVKCVFG